MSKAEERALEAYPYSEAYTDSDIEYDGNFCNRLPYIEGYEQAEEDLKLTWKDINNIKLIIDQVESDYVEQDKKLYSKYFYQEVLKQFNEKSGK